LVQNFTIDQRVGNLGSTWYDWPYMTRSKSGTFHCEAIFRVALYTEADSKCGKYRDYIPKSAYVLTITMREYLGHTLESMVSDLMLEGEARECTTCSYKWVYNPRNLSSSETEFNPYLKYVPRRLHQSKCAQYTIQRTYKGKHPKNGKDLFRFSGECKGTCKEKGPFFYCCRECQLKDWKRHSEEDGCRAVKNTAKTKLLKEEVSWDSLAEQFQRTAEAQNIDLDGSAKRFAHIATMSGVSPAKVLFQDMVTVITQTMTNIRNMELSQRPSDLMTEVGIESYIASCVREKFGEKKEEEVEVKEVETVKTDTAKMKTVDDPKTEESNQLEGFLHELEVQRKRERLLRMEEEEEAKIKSDMAKIEEEKKMKLQAQRQAQAQLEKAVFRTTTTYRKTGYGKKSSPKNEPFVNSRDLLRKKIASEKRKKGNLQPVKVKSCKGGGTPSLPKKVRAKQKKKPQPTEYLHRRMNFKRETYEEYKSRMEKEKKLYVNMLKHESNRARVGTKFLRENDDSYAEIDTHDAGMNVVALRKAILAEALKKHETRNILVNVGAGSHQSKQGKSRIMRDYLLELHQRWNGKGDNLLFNTGNTTEFVFKKRMLEAFGSLPRKFEVKEVQKGKRLEECFLWIQLLT
jgi:hypothetical protein